MVLENPLPVWRWHITLADSDPPIWRRFEAPAGLTLAEFHPVIQTVMGWSGDRPYQFKVPGQEYPAAIAPRREAGKQGGDRAPSLGPLTLTLADLNLRPGDKLAYTYDLRDGWLHVLQLEEIRAGYSKEEPPYRCIAGERACPPLDSGGMWGYEDLLERLGDPEDPEYEDLLTWVGFDFDPDVFNLTAVNQHLQRIINDQSRPSG